MATDIDIGNLPDEELREKLQKYGVNVGPIGSSTRLFYEKKLAKLMELGGQQPSQSETEESEEGEEEEEEEEDEEVQFQYKKESVPQRPAPQPISTPVTLPDRNYTPITQARTATPTQSAIRRNVTSRQDEYQQPPKTKVAPSQKTGGGISMWLKLIFVLVVAFLVYLVVINMNPSAENKIPLTFDSRDNE